MAKRIWPLVFTLEAVQARGKDLCSKRWSWASHSGLSFSKGKWQFWLRGSERVIKKGFWNIKCIQTSSYDDGGWDWIQHEQEFENKSSWHDVISFEMTASRSEWSEETMLLGNDGGDYMVGFIWQREWETFGTNFLLSPHLPSSHH